MDGTFKEKNEDIRSTEYNYDEESSSPKMDDPSNRFEKTEKEEPKVGDLNCFCHPHRVFNLGDILQRTRQWALLNFCEITGGIGVALTLIPDAIWYASIAGLKPTASLRSIWIMTILTSIIHGRPMISGTTGAVAIVISTLVEDIGPGYIFYTVILAGVFQTIFGLLRLGFIFKFISLPVYLGFLSSVGILEALSQLRYFKVELNFASISLTHFHGILSPILSPCFDGAPWVDYITCIIMVFECIGSLLICFLFPLITKNISNVLIAILVITSFEWGCIRPLGYFSPLISDLHSVENTLDTEQPPFNFESFRKIFKYSFILFATSLIQSTMTASYVEKQTSVQTKRNLIAIGQGISEIVSGSLRGMGGSAMTVRTVLNVKSGSVSRLSSFVAGIFFFCFAVAWPIFYVVPLASIVGVTFYAAFHMIQETFPLLLAAILPERVRKRLNITYKIERCETFIIAVIIIVSIFYDFAIGIVAGVLLQLAEYAHGSSKKLVIKREYETGVKNAIYYITGPIFFGTSEKFSIAFSYDNIKSDPPGIIISLEGAEIFDYSGLIAIHNVYERITKLGKTLVFSGVSPASKRIMGKMSDIWKDTNFLELEEVQEHIDKDSVRFENNEVGYRFDI